LEKLKFVVVQAIVTDFTTADCALKKLPFVFSIDLLLKVPVDILEFEKKKAFDFEVDVIGGGLLKEFVVDFKLLFQKLLEAF
jgi:hypothetical protein